MRKKAIVDACDFLAAISERFNVRGIAASGSQHGPRKAVSNGLNVPGIPSILGTVSKSASIEPIRLALRRLDPVRFR